MQESIKIARINRPFPIVMLLVPTILGLMINSDFFIGDFLIFCIGGFAMRSFGCVVNDMFDKEIDKNISRTSNRLITNKMVSCLTISLSVVFYLLISFVCFLLLSQSAKIFSIIALVLSIFYPYSKRITYYPQIILGITFNMGFLIAFVHVNRSFTLQSIFIYIGFALSTIVYDSIYAISDYIDDKTNNIKSIITKHASNIDIILYTIQTTAFSCFLLSYKNKINILFLSYLIMYLLFSYTIIYISMQKFYNNKFQKISYINLFDMYNIPLLFVFLAFI
jgi:4-hydroxybenzoate polyprenyltransferase